MTRGHYTQFQLQFSLVYNGILRQGLLYFFIFIFVYTHNTFYLLCAWYIEFTLMNALF